MILRPNHQDPAPAPWEITNSTNISTTTHESNLANNAGGTALGVVPAEIDLDVAQTDLVDPVAYNPGVPGDNLITYRITVNNFGPSYATGVNFTDSFTPPAGTHRLKFICDKAAAADNCTEMTLAQICTGQGTIANGGVQESVNCVVGDMAANSSYERYLVFEVLDTPVAGGETHQKQVTISANENDIVPANDQAVEQTTVRIRTDVAVACAAPPASVSIRQPFSLQLTVSNNGPGASQETTLNQSLPAGLVLTAAPTPAGGGSCTGSAGSSSYSCDLGNLPAAASNVVTVPVRFVNMPGGGTYTTSAAVSSNEIDMDAGNDSCSTAVASVVQSSIAGFVYEDHNDNGVMDPGETPIEGVSVRLTGTDAYGNAVDETRTTTITGSYGFYSRSPSDANGYTLTQTAPPGYVDGLENAGGSSVLPGSRSSDVISAISLAAGESKVHYDFGELPADLEVVSKTPSGTNISLREPFSYVIVVRNNGPADATGSTLSDVLPAGMQLTAAPTTTAGSCNGVAGGTSFTCSFGTIASGDSVTISYPVIVSATGNLANTATVAGDLNEITLANNSRNSSIVASASSIACLVYQDLDNNGVQDNGEPGIGGVAVTLGGTDDFGNVVNVTQNTQPDGSCLFDNLSPSTSGNGGGYTLSEAQPAGYNDGKENNGGTVDQGSGNGSDQIGPIDLAAATHLPTHQFGERPPTGISGTVWHDQNNNGVIDGTEPERIEGVTITLTGTELGSSTPISPITTQTNASGAYQFPDLNAGTYTITQGALPAGYLPGLAAAGTGASTTGTANNVPPGAGDFGSVISGIVLQASDVAVSYNFGELRPASIAGTVFNDTNRNDARDNGEPGIGGVEISLSCTDYRGGTVSLSTTTAADGTYSFADLPPSSGQGCTLTQTQPAGYDDGAELPGNLGGSGDDLDAGSDNINSIVLASGDAGINYDFAERSAGLSGHVYVDSDNDGIFDNGETPIAGVSMDLLDAGGNVVQSVLTDANGYYLFTGLQPGTYSVRETVQPAAWADGLDTAGSVGGNTDTNDIIGGIVLAATDFATDYNFGETGASLSGTVFTDLDSDGSHDGTEPGIPGVTLTLACTTIDANSYQVTTTTGSDGSYSFNDVPASDAAGCTISETQPANSSDGQDSVGTLGGDNSVNDVISAIMVAAGSEGSGYDFGEVLTSPARISGHVWHDGNHDRANNDNSPRSGWTVELVQNTSSCTSTPVIIATQSTDASGAYAFEGVSPGNYGIRFRSPEGGYLYAGTQSGGSTGDDIACGIANIAVAAGDDIVDQDLPLDPSGVVYDSLSRNPVAGATVTISGPAGFDPASDLVGGVANVTQTTGADGYYQFLLHMTAPAGEYTLSIGQPSGYVPGNSSIIPACTNRLNVGPVPDPALVQTAAVAPSLSASTHDPAACPSGSAALAAGAGSTQYYLAFQLTPGTSANVVNNHIPLDPVTSGAFTLSKTTPKVNVSIGQLVPYTITARNNLAAGLSNIEIEDQIPPGFKYKPGSAMLDGVRVEPVIAGRQLTWTGLSFAAGQKRIVKLLLIVGTGVSEGDYVNRAWAENGFVQALASNVATARVRVTADPTFDCAGVIGKVFDDKNRNGYQDKGEPGLANIRLATVRGLLVTTDSHGRYHVACADVPNRDRGSGFVMKLDVRTLPSGYRLTTENPRIIRLTRGKIGKLNFGAAIHRVVRLDIAREAFGPHGDRLKPVWEKGISRLVGVLDKGPSILRIAYSRSFDESRQDVRKRINIIRKKVEDLWKRKRRRALVIETESYISDAGSFK